MAIFLLAMPTVVSADNGEIMLEQTNTAEVSYWIPIVSTFYVGCEDSAIGKDGIPEFSRCPSIRTPNFYHLGAPPNLESDWRKLQEFIGRDKPPSGWVTSDKFWPWEGRKRLFAHATAVQADRPIGVPTGRRLLVFWGLDLAKEGFPTRLKREELLWRISIVPEKCHLFSRRVERTNRYGELGTTDVEKEYRGGLSARGANQISVADVPSGDFRKELREVQKKKGVTILPRFYLWDVAPISPRFIDARWYDPTEQTEFKSFNGVVELELVCTLEADGTLFGENEKPEQKIVSGKIRFVANPVGFYPRPTEYRTKDNQGSR